MENKLNKTKVIFVIGRSASGKSTVSRLLSDELSKKNKCVLVDADDLGKYNIKPLPGIFTFEARLERNKFMLKIIDWLSEQAEIIIVAGIGQPKEIRDMWKDKFKESTLIYLKSNIDTCEKRDFKGIYKLKHNVIGKDLPFIEPLESNIVVNVDKIDAIEACKQVLKKYNELNNK